MYPKRIIFHHPEPIPEEGAAGSQVRPRRMIEAFQGLGYRVDVVAGFAEERRKSIESITSRLQSGQGYDFLYAETSTTPTLLTEKNHLPLHPNLDFRFFHNLKRRRVPTGLFYRDVQWRFDLYRQAVPIYKRAVTIPFYWYEWLRYRSLIDCLFLPSIRMKDALPSYWPEDRITALPPGCNITPISEKHEEYDSTRDLKLFYVGGVTPPLYDLKLMTQIHKETEGVTLKICCNPDEWEAIQSYYAVEGTENIQIVHAHGSGLRPYFEQADVFSLFWRPNPYLDFAMPVKIFEAIGYGLPIITSDGTEAARFISQEEIGWRISSPNDYKNLLHFLKNNPEEIAKKREKVVAVQDRHTWRMRAMQVTSSLLS